MVHEVFHDLYDDWKRKLTSDQTKNATKSSIYRYRGDEVENEEKEEFNKLFPNYDESSEFSGLPSNPDVQDPQTLARLVSTLHSDLFRSSRAATEQLVSLLQDSGKKAALIWEKYKTLSPFPLPAENMLPIVMLAMDCCVKHLSHSTPAPKMYNFYTDSSLGEAQKLILLVHRIKDKFKEIQQTWPEHVTLEDVLRTSEELLTLRHSEPLAKILTKCEQLHSYIHEWQAITSREHTAVVLYNDLTDLLVSWRRLELATWASLLDVEDGKCIEDAKAWWFVAYEVIVAASLSAVASEQDFQRHIEQLINTLGEFLHTTSLGQYSERIRLLEVFTDHLELLAKEIPLVIRVRSALINLLAFYSKFAPLIHELILKGRQKLEKDLKEVVLLASWKDTNIIALRESAKRSHHKLFKVVRKYRNILSQPVGPTIEQGLPELSPQESVKIYSYPALGVDPKALDLCKTCVQGWAEKPPHFKDPMGTAATMVHLFRSTGELFNFSAYLDSLSSNIVDSIKLLQKETPAILTTENKDDVKHLKSRKRKLFADVLKELRVMGFKSNIDSETFSQQNSLSVVLSNMAPLEGSDADLSPAENYFHKALENMIIIRGMSKEHSEDLNSSEIARSMGFLEGILVVILQQRNSLSNVLSTKEYMSGIIELLGNMWQPENYTIQRADETATRLHCSIQECVQWLPTILETGQIVISKYTELANVSYGALTESINQHCQTYLAIGSKIKGLPKLPNGLSSSLHQRLYEEAGGSLSLLADDLNTWKSQYPNLEFVFKQIRPWTIPDVVPAISVMNGITPTTVAQIDQQLSRIIDTILVGIQCMKDTLDTIAGSGGDPSWLIRTNLAISKSLRDLHVHDISHQLSCTLAHLRKIDNADDLKTAAALSAMALPIISQYDAVHNESIRRYAKMHKSLCRTLCILTTSFKQIVADGFCSPSEKLPQESGQSEKLEEGMGLGEGEGAEDISKDVQHDEDLSELAQAGQRDGDKQDIEDHDDAVDMQNEDLEGEVGDSGDKGEEDQSDAESDDGEDQLDEETGDVDDLDPSALDEKLWDGPGDAAEKKKDTQKSTGKKSDEMAAQDELKEDEKQAGGSEELDEVGADEGEEITHSDTEELDPHLQEEQCLDLPDELELDGDKGSVTGSDDDGGAGDEMEDVSDVEEASNGQEEDIAHDQMDQATEEITMDLTDQAEQGDDEAFEKNKEVDSPVDTEPEDEEMDDQGLLRDQTNDSAVDAENPDHSDARGLNGCLEMDVENNEGKENDSRGNQGDQSNSASHEDSLTAATTGERGHAEARADSAPSQQDSLADSIESKAFKKLGDALDEWHRRRQKIQDAFEDIDKNKIDGHGPMDVDEQNQEFEHLPNDDTEGETQVLGAATEDQAHALDRRALDSETQEEPKDFLPDPVDVENTSAEDQSMQDHNHDTSLTDDQGENARPGAILGPNPVGDQQLHTSELHHLEKDEDIQEIDNELSIVHLESRAYTTHRSRDEARQLWSHYENRTRDLSLVLTEQLRLILAPTLATKMRGDFRTGKRLNIKRIIPYIASDYKRDKIWMRRSVPSKRNYQIMLAVDDSKSMGESGSGRLAFETLALVSKSLGMLEVGEICIVGFGNDVHVVHAFDQTFSSEAGVHVFQQFTFQQTKTNVQKLIAKSIDLFQEARYKSLNSGVDLWQLQLIISDGVCEDHESIRRLVRKARDERIMIVFVIVDALKGESIMDMTQASFEPDQNGETRLIIKRYLEGFPFGYYLIVGDVKDLPGVLATALRQWFAEVVESG
jgi:midasin